MTKSKSSSSFIDVLLILVTHLMNGAHFSNGTRVGVLCISFD